MTPTEKQIEAACAVYWGDHWNVFNATKVSIRETMSKALSAALAVEAGTDAENWAATWHKTVETMCVLLDINGSGSPEEILTELQAAHTTSPVDVKPLGWTGNKCKPCGGHGVRMQDGEERRCPDCAGTGDEYAALTEDDIGPNEQALRDAVEPFLDWLEQREEGAHIKEVRDGLIGVEDVIPDDHVVLGAHPRAHKDHGVLTIGHFRRLQNAYDGKGVREAPEALTPASSGVEGEAVAWLHPTANWCDVDRLKVLRHCFNDGPDPIPLYAHPAPTPAGDAMLRLAVAAVLEADKEFRSNMGPSWEGDPLSDEIDGLRRIFEALLASPAPHQEGCNR